MIIATSGHVDHGKTALLEALTGKNTAHLPDEKKRGMTIDLGYAYLPLDDGRVLGFIDVPGHAKFLSNMLAGLGGVDYAMLVVAADEGIMPQTEEHLTILSLLDFKQIMVVITKADKASQSAVEALQVELKQRYAALRKSPFFVTSVRTGQGIRELSQRLSGLDNDDIHKHPFRYAIDRTFTIKGAGTVVTGTAFSGHVKVDDVLFLSSSSANPVRVKNIHAQNQVSVVGLAGERLALNLVGKESSQIQRGDWLFDSPNAFATDRITVLVNPVVALKASQDVHIYHAANHIVGKCTLLEAQCAAIGKKVLAELTLQQGLFLCAQDKLILRSADNSQTLAGAYVLETDSPTRYKRTPQRLQYLHQLVAAKSKMLRIAAYLQQKSMEKARLCWVEQLTSAQFYTYQQQLGFHCVNDFCFDEATGRRLRERLLESLAQYHQDNPDQLGVAKARLARMAAIKQPSAVMFYLIEQLLSEKALQQSRGWLHLPSHKIAFSTDEAVLWQKVHAEFVIHAQAIWVRDLANQFELPEREMRNFLYKAGKLGYLTPVVRDRFFLTEEIERIAKLIKAHIQREGGISVNELRDALGFGRKLTVQLIEYYDKCGFLWRRGNRHVLRDGDVF
ncbi:selenocysteine-specific translation elongation factor [Pasteurellaceae bacterium HPA106]|uniref:selenocysteine-specific translation elongation factor n=1 Tax=Spirabiliibacterium pneumoniae TaxID=221400 RepID=UPI001AAC5114|nr:selenocysteine-specific translation elongation factor [Spirabiliibacterium pneumoniae]MBE2896996.1 selenocysteine-specific translation elongation factor [Spirabiliibacterium pneumoniae]